MEKKKELGRTLEQFDVLRAVDALQPVADLVLVPVSAVVSIEMVASRSEDD